MSDLPVSILVVCLGNICRSPTAEAVLRRHAEQRGLTHRLSIDSAGTSSWHIGSPPDKRSTLASAARGYHLSSLRGRQVSAADFERFDYILAMDSQNLADLHSLKPAGYKGHLGLFLDFADSADGDVPDPYHGGAEGFEHVLDLVEQASQGLLEHLRAGMD